MIRDDLADVVDLPGVDGPTSIPQHRLHAPYVPKAAAERKGFLASIPYGPCGRRGDRSPQRRRARRIGVAAGQENLELMSQ